MQFKTLALSLFVTAAAADTITDLVAQMPTCSLSCFVSGNQAISCSMTDYNCQCQKQEELTNAVSPCILKACSTSDIATVTKLSAQICAAVKTSGSSSGASSAAASATKASNSTAAATGTSSGSSASSTSTTGTSGAGRVEIGMGLVAAAVAAMAL